MISAVVINWNGEDYLQGCLDALLTQVPPPDEVIVVDNHSEDGSRALVRERYPQVELVDVGYNSGPSMARNMGVERARHDRVLLVDNDAQLQPGALAHLDAALDEHQDAAAVQARSLCADRPDVVHYDWTELGYLGLIVLHNWFVPLSEASDPKGPTGGLIGLCFLARRDRYREVGGFNPDLFVMEDVDFAWRLRLRGHKFYVVPDAHVLHGAGTANLSFRHGSQGYPGRRVYHHSRNRWLVLLTCLRWRTVIVLLPAQLVYGGIQFLFALVKLHPGAWFAGKWDQLKAIARLRQWRRAAQEGRCVADRDLLVGGPLTLHPGIADRGPAALLRSLLNGFFGLYWRVFSRLCG